MIEFITRGRLEWPLLLLRFGFEVPDDRMGRPELLWRLLVFSEGVGSICCWFKDGFRWCEVVFFEVVIEVDPRVLGPNIWQLGHNERGEINTIELNNLSKLN